MRELGAVCRWKLEKRGFAGWCVGAPPGAIGAHGECLAKAGDGVLSFPAEDRLTQEPAAIAKARQAYEAEVKAAADKKAAEKPDKAKSLPRLRSAVRTSDEIKAFFRRGIAVQSHGTGKHASKPKKNRIYTAGELISRFGKPDERETSATNETWIFVCSDGKVRISFLNKGYGGATGPGVENNLRLQIIGTAERLFLASMCS